jgi:hypothetical protein
MADKRSANPSTGQVGYAPPDALEAFGLLMRDIRFIDRPPDALAVAAWHIRDAPWRKASMMALTIAGAPTLPASLPPFTPRRFVLRTGYIGDDVRHVVGAGHGIVDE